MDKVTSDTIVSELITEHPDLIKVFEAHGLDVEAECSAVQDTSLEYASLVCGFDPQEMVEELNLALAKTRSTYSDSNANAKDS